MARRAAKRNRTRDDRVQVTTSDIRPDEETACGNDGHMWLELGPEAFRFLGTDLNIRATEHGIGTSSV